MNTTKQFALFLQQNQHITQEYAMRLLKKTRLQIKHIERVAGVKLKMLKPSKRVLTIKKVLEVEKHGLSINKSAYLLGVSMPKLWRFIEKNNIQWRGKNPCFRKNEVNPNSTSQRIKKSGICKATIYYRINVMGMTLDEAIARGSSNK